MIRGRAWLGLLVLAFLSAPSLASAANEVIAGSGNAIWIALGSFAGQVFGAVTVVDRKIHIHAETCTKGCKS